MMLNGGDPGLWPVSCTRLCSLHLAELLLANRMLYALDLRTCGCLCTLWPHSIIGAQNRVCLLLLLLDRLWLLEILDLPGLEPVCYCSLLLWWSICLLSFLLLLDIVILRSEVRSVFIGSQHSGLLFLATSLHHLLLLLRQRLTVHHPLALYLSYLILHLVHDIFSILLLILIVIVVLI